MNGTNKKGDVLTVAQIAGITGAKQTSSLVPLSHQVNLKSIQMSNIYRYKLSQEVIDIISAFGKLYEDLPQIPQLFTSNPDRVLFRLP